MNERKLTGFLAVKHIQGKKHIEKLVADVTETRKKEIMATRWLLHQLLEDTEFFASKTGNPPPADHNKEAIWRACTRRDHATIEALKDGNTFASEGLSRMSETCFLYKCEHCPEAGCSTP